MPRFRVYGDVKHAFVHEIEAANEDAAWEAVERLSHRVLDVDTSNSASVTEVQGVEEIEE